MNESIFLTDTSPEARVKLMETGFHICSCCYSDNVKWFHFYYRELKDSQIKEVHGAGNGCDNECPGRSCEKCLACHIKESIRYKHDVHIFNDVDRFVEYINRLYT